MIADSHDGFTYEPARDHASVAARRHYWAVAIGLQAVDGLKASTYLRELAEGYARGTYSLAQTGSLIRGISRHRPAVRHRSAPRRARIRSARRA